MHQTSPRKSSHTSSHSCKRTNPVRERTTRCRWLLRLCLTRTSMILRLIFRQSRSMSSRCRVDSNYRFGTLTFDPTAGRIRFGLARVFGAQSFGILQLAEADIRGPRFHNLRPRMSAVGRYCCKSRKSNNPKNLAKVDLWTFLMLRRFSSLLGMSVVDFGSNDMVLHAATGKRHQRL